MSIPNETLLINQILVPTGNKVGLIGKPCRIVAVYPDRDTVFLIALESPLKLPFALRLSKVKQAIDAGMVSVGNLQLSRATFSGLDKVKPRYKKLAGAAWNRLQPVLKHSIDDLLDVEIRSIVVRDAAKSARCHPKQIRRDFFAYLAGGQTKNGLVPKLHACGPKRGLRANHQRSAGRRSKLVKHNLVAEADIAYVKTEEGRRRIKRGILQFINKVRAKREIWKLTLGHYFSNGFIEVGSEVKPILLPENQRPTYRQFNYEWKLLDRDFELTKQRCTDREWEQSGKARFVRVSKQAFGPLHRFEIDATVLDTYVVSRFNRNWIVGRPVLYVVIDVYSRMVVGFYLGFEGPNWSGARLALFNAFSNKVEFCARYGIHITEADWPCHHLPLKILGDGGELLGLESDSLQDSMKIAVENTAPYRGDWKPFVESRFRLVNRARVSFVPGAVNARKDEMRERDYVLDACLTCDEVTQLLIRCFINANKHAENREELPEGMISAGILDSTPISVWNWGLRNLTCAARVVDPAVAYRNLLPKKAASVRADGIYIEGKRFTCETAEASHWFERAMRKGSWKVEARCDPSRFGLPLIEIKDSCTFEPGKPLDIDQLYEKAREEEVLDLMELQSLVSALKQGDKDSDEVAASVTAVVIEANAKKELEAVKDATKRTKRISEISKNRDLEKQAEQLRNARAQLESRGKSPRLAATKADWDLDSTDDDMDAAISGFKSE